MRYLSRIYLFFANFISSRFFSKLQTFDFLFVNQTIGPLFQDIIDASRVYGSSKVFKGFPYFRTSYLLRFLSWSLFSFQVLIYLLIFSFRYKRFLFVSNPPFVPLLSLFCTKPYALLLYDLYPQVLSQLNPQSSFIRLMLRLLIQLWHYTNSYIYSNAQCIFTLSAPMAKELLPYFSTEEEWLSRVHVIPPWSNVAIVRSSTNSVSEFREQYFINRLLVAYSGNIGITHPLEPLIDSMVENRSFSQSLRYQVFIIGHGAKKQALLDRSRKLNIPAYDLRFLEPLPYEQLSVSLSSADFAVVALDGPSSFASMPSKTFNALACGTPILVIAPKESALAKLVFHFKCGILIEPGENASYILHKTLSFFADRPDQLRTLSRNALHASSYFTSINADKLMKIWLSA